MPVMSVGWRLIPHRWASQEWSWCPAGILGNCPTCFLGTSPPPSLPHHARRGGLVLPQPWIHTTKVLSHWAATVTPGRVSVTRHWVGTSSHQEHWAWILSHCTALTSQPVIKLLPINIQGWSPLGLTGLISLQSKGLSRVFSNTTVQKHHLELLIKWLISSKFSWPDYTLYNNPDFVFFREMQPWFHMWLPYLVMKFCGREVVVSTLLNVLLA